MIRDHSGNWVRGFGYNLGWCKAVKAEMMALLKCLRLAWEDGHSKIEIQLDSQVTVQKIQEPCSRNQAHYFIIKECQELI